MDNQAHWKDIIRYAGAITAFLIGSGFASGQEVMQFFTSYGLTYSGLTIVLSFVIFIWFTSTVLADARELQLKNTNSIFKFYCGKHIGIFFEWLTPLFLFMVFVVMLAGAGAIAKEYFGLDTQYGRFVMAFATLFTVLLGLEKLVDILGNIGPVIIIYVICIGLASIYYNWEGLSKADKIISSVNIVHATGTWWLSGFTYTSFCAVTLLPFLAGIGKTTRSDKDARYGGIVGSIAFMLAVIVLSYGMLACIENIWSKDVPSIYIANQICIEAGIIFAIVMILGIYTTATPMLWSVCNKICSNERSLLYRGGAVILTIIAYYGGNLSFSTLVNIIYPYMGYMGMLVLGGILIKHLKYKNKNK